jgi:hypothetical protein
LARYAEWSSDYQWFQREDYAPQREFIELVDWAWMLGVRLVLSDIDLNLMPPERKETFWHEFQQRVCPRIYLERKRRGELPPRPLASPAVRDVTHEILGPGAEKIANALAFGQRVLLIDPWASDESLERDFGQCLRQQRTEMHFPFRRPGRPSPKIGIKPRYFSRWADHSILAVYDLKFYGEVFQKTPLKGAALHEAIGPDSEDPEEWAKKARRLLKQAIDGFPFLIAQARSGGK